MKSGYGKYIKCKIILGNIGDYVNYQIGRRHIHARINRVELRVKS